MRRPRRAPIGCSVAVVAVVASAFLFGAPGAIVAGVLAFLGLAALFDNHTGSVLMLAVVFVVVLAILFMLMALMVARPA